MTPNTLRIALSLVMVGAAPLGLTAFPQQALSEVYTPKPGQQAEAEIMPAPAAATTDAEAMDTPTVETPEAEATDAENTTVDATDAEAMDAEAMDAEAAGAEAEATTSETLTIADIAAGNENFEILSAAIEAADLTEALSSEDISVTVFAPTDDAFEALPEGALETLLLPENRDQLIQLLTYHVVDGEMRSTELTSGEVSTLAGTPVMVTVDEEAVTVNQANLLAADIEASNGVIHVIDSVLLPM